ncbi:MAG: methionyl-tRNA formyltransferase [Cohaesibacter sp.]|jgi:methionyl-tRNA formyltransferase|nr:methionyl-tRNA formyltransferase [Cohaesibacter sp.]
MKIGYFGDGPWASLALKHIVSRPQEFEIMFITPRFDTQDPELKKAAKDLGVPFIPHENVNSPDFINQIKSYDCDVLVSMSFNQILRQDIINAAPLGFINCHAGDLPFYRGRNPLNWVLVNGENAFGVTVHYVDEGIDTGDIIAQEMVPIQINDTYATLLEKAHISCAQVLLDALTLIGSGKVEPRKQSQIHPVGTYYGMRRAGDEWLDWEAGSQDIHNFVRAITHPGPGARCLSQFGEVAILETRLVAGAKPYKATAGEVVGRSDEGVIVKTGDTALLVTKALYCDEENKPGTPFIPRWRIGTRLGQTAIAQLHEMTGLVRKMQQEICELRSEIQHLKLKP